MAKTLQDYLGSSATIQNGVVTLDLTELYKSIFPNTANDYIPKDNNSDETLAVLIAGIHARSKPILDENGLDVTPNTTALVAAESFQSKTFVTREDISQLQHEFVFNIYTEDNAKFNPLTTV